MKATRRTLLVVLSLLLVAPEAVAQDAGVSAETESAKMIRILRGMSDLLSRARSFGFTVHELADEVEDGLRIQYSNTRSVVVRRPDRLASEALGDLFDRAFWYDGKSFTLLDREHNSYFQSQAPETIDALLDDIAERFQVVLPLGEILSEDIYKNLTQRIQIANYAGLHQVRGIRCHHFIFTQEALDW